MQEVRGKRTSEDVMAPEGLPLGEPTGKPEEDEKSKDDLARELKA